MNDRTIPFIRQYDESVILTAARRSAASWRKRRYDDHSMVVPENKRYLAANSMKRNPAAPRGARFPVRSSKFDQTLTPDDDSCDDGRIPVLPPGPSTATGTLSFPNGGVDWNSGSSSDRPIEPLPGPSQLPFNGSFSRFAPASWTGSWGSTYPQSYPPSDTPSGTNYWPTCTCTSPVNILEAYLTTESDPNPPPSRYAK